MKRIKYFATGLWVDKHLGQWITTIIIMVNFGLGTVIVVGGIERFGSDSYEPLLNLSGGLPWLWGLAIILSSVLTATPFRWPNIIGLWIGTIWHIIWTACFITAVLQYDTADSTTIPMFGGMAMIGAALLTARVIDKSGG